MFTREHLEQKRIKRFAIITIALCITISLGFVYRARASPPNDVASVTNSTSLTIYTKSLTSGEVGAGWSVPLCEGSFDTATYHTVQGLKKTFTTDSDGVLEITFSGMGRNSENYGSIYSAIFIDGQPLTNAFGHEQLGGCRNDGSTAGHLTWCNMTNIGAQSINAGAHTVEIKVKCDLDAEGWVWNGWMTVKVHGQ